MEPLLRWFNLNTLLQTHVCPPSFLPLSPHPSTETRDQFLPFTSLFTSTLCCFLLGPTTAVRSISRDASGSLKSLPSDFRGQATRDKPSADASATSWPAIPFPGRCICPIGSEIFDSPASISSRNVIRLSWEVQHLRIFEEIEIYACSINNVNYEKILYSTLYFSSCALSPFYFPKLL